MGRTVRTMAAPPVLYYLAIDGTEAQDAVVFSTLLEQRGWKNLASTYLKPAPDEPNRLVDPEHDFLPVWMVRATPDGERVAVVLPNGRNGKGIEGMWWNRYPAHTKGADGRMVEGRYAAAELGAAFMQQLILRPRIDQREKAPNVFVRHLADDRLGSGSRRGPAASILYVSSHGWQNGEMRGDGLLANLALPSAIGEDYQPATPFFLLGQAIAKGGGFDGPQWIVLAQCSTLNWSTWQLWARLLARSSPGVRGILAYEEGSPKPDPAVKVAERFFGALDQGAPFLDAWIDANRYMPWAALVHKEARKDTLGDFPRFRKLSRLSSSEKQASYHGYLSSLGAGGEPVYDRPPPFGFRLQHMVGNGFEEVSPERIGDPVANLKAGDLYRLIIDGPELCTLREVTITAVHLRLSLRKQITWDRLFASHVPIEGVKLDGFGTTTISLRPDAATDLSFIRLRLTANHPVRAGMERHHSYLWFRVGIRTDTDTFQYDFRNIGFRC